MFNRLPPLQTLRAFEAAGRLLSMTLAAEELHVTHGAVSRHIKTLENHLGVPLFKRLTRRIVLTEEGEQFHVAVGRLLGELTREAELVRTRSSPDDQYEHFLGEQMAGATPASLKGSAP